MTIPALIIASIIESKRPILVVSSLLLGGLLYTYIGLCTFNVTWPRHYSVAKAHNTNSSLYDREPNREWRIESSSRSDATTCATITGMMWPLYWTWRGLEWAASWSIPKENP